MSFESQLIFYLKGRAAPSFSIFFFIPGVGEKEQEGTETILGPAQIITLGCSRTNPPNPSSPSSARCAFKGLVGKGWGGRQRRS